MKKNNNATATLKKLNSLYAAYSRASEKVAEEYRKVMSGEKKSRKDFDAKKNELDMISRQFDELRGEMPWTKFDMASGEYFYAGDGDRAVFAIRVRRTDTFNVRVAAGSAGEAIDKAMMQVARENGIPMECLEAEDYSR